MDKAKLSTLGTIAYRVAVVVLLGLIAFDGVNVNDITVSGRPRRPGAAIPVTIENEPTVTVDGIWDTVTVEGSVSINDMPAVEVSDLPPVEVSDLPEVDIDDPIYVVITE